MVCSKATLFAVILIASAVFYQYYKPKDTDQSNQWKNKNDKDIPELETNNIAIGYKLN